MFPWVCRSTWNPNPSGSPWLNGWFHRSNWVTMRTQKTCRKGVTDDIQGLPNWFRIFQESSWSEITSKFNSLEHIGWMVTFTLKKKKVISHIRELSCKNLKHVKGLLNESNGFLHRRCRLDGARHCWIRKIKSNYHSDCTRGQQHPKPAVYVCSKFTRRFPSHSALKQHPGYSGLWAVKLVGGWSPSQLSFY